MLAYTKTQRGIELPQTADFDLDQTLNCGQCFRWYAGEKGSYFGIVAGKWLRISADSETKTIVFHNTTEEEFEKIWIPYFDLEMDYGAIRRSLSDLDPVLACAAQYAPGIRILRQDPWEALCSFILSQNNNIPRIKGIVERLCQTFGDPVPGGYRFPEAKRLAKLSVEDLAPLRCGFRAKYLCSAAQLVENGTVSLSELETMPIEQARESLMQITGVGPKVAECALLYGWHRLECFPMDVWMKRAMAYLFPGKKIEDFGRYAGIAQQYIFHYSRQNSQVFDGFIKK